MIPRSFDDFARGAGDLDVALGAALIARDVYGALDVPKLLARFDDLAAPLGDVASHAPSAGEAARILALHVYGGLLPDVLDRRLGIPISLALVYYEIARRAGLEAEGVGFPGHFLVRISIYLSRGDLPLESLDHKNDRWPTE